MNPCILINNKNLARQRISSFVEDQYNWPLDVKSAERKKAKNIFLKYRSDVFFINVMGGCDINLARELAITLNCHGVFATASIEQAFQAFDLEAADYLFKPLENNRLTNVLHRVEGQKKRALKQCKNVLAVKSANTVEFVNVEDIVRIQGSEEYVKLHCSARKLLHSETLCKLEMYLNPKKFICVHPSAMVNIEKIDLVSSELGRFLLLHLNNSDEVKVDQHLNALLRPSFTSRPSVENSIKYASAQMPNVGLVGVKAKCQRGYLQMEVADNGPTQNQIPLVAKSKTEGKTASSHTGVRVQNIVNKLNVLCPNDHNFKVIRGLSDGYRVQISILMEHL